MQTAASRNSVLVVVAVVLFVVAGGVWYFNSGADDEAETAQAAPADKTVSVECAECGATWDMSAAEYRQKVADRSDSSAKLVCDKCGKSSAWKTGGAGLTLGTPSKHLRDEALDSTKEGEYQSDPAKKRKSLGPALRPDDQ